MRDIVGAVKFQSGLICHFIQKLAQRRQAAAPNLGNHRCHTSIRRHKPNGLLWAYFPGD